MVDSKIRVVLTPLRDVPESGAEAERKRSQNGLQSQTTVDPDPSPGSDRAPKAGRNEPSRPDQNLLTSLPKTRVFSQSNRTRILFFALTSLVRYTDLQNNQVAYP